jgi:predicted RNA-binding Zn-ribbon protein involved in translation (DUF1610 family)
MGILSRLFGRKKKCPGCGFDLSKVSVMTSSVLNIRCPMCGTNISNQMQVFDLRPESERRIELEAQHDLGGEDEQLARKVLSLQMQRGSKEAETEIRKVGEHLGANGGSDRMARVAYRVEALGGSSRQLEWSWSGICGWQP